MEAGEEGDQTGGERPHRDVYGRAAASQGIECESSPLIVRVEGIGIELSPKWTKLSVGVYHS